MTEYSHSLLRAAPSMPYTWSFVHLNIHPVIWKYEMPRAFRLAYTLCVCVWMCVCVCLYIYIYIYTHTHEAGLYM